MREALIADAGSDCNHRVAGVPVDGLGDKVDRMMCGLCGAFFVYYTIQFLPVKVTAEQGAAIRDQFHYQQLAYNHTIAYLSDLMRDSLELVQDTADCGDALGVIPSCYDLNKKLTEWRKNDYRFVNSNGSAVLQRIGVREARDAMIAHVKSWYKAKWRAKFYKGKDRDPRKADQVMIGKPVWETKGPLVLNERRETMFRRKDRKTQWTVSVESGYYDHDLQGWKIPKVDGLVESRKVLDKRLNIRSFQIIETSGPVDGKRRKKRGRDRWRVNVQVLLRVQKQPQYQT